MNLALVAQLLVMGLVIWVVVEVSEFFISKFLASKQVLGSKRPLDKDDSLPT